MPLRRKPHLSIGHWLGLAAITLLPLAAGFPLLGWQAERDLASQSRFQAAQAVAALERVLDNAAAAAQALAALPGQPCEQAVLELRRQVTGNPYVRSTALATPDTVYCTSLQGPYSEALAAGDFVAGRLRLFAADRVTPGRALLVYRHPTTQGSALATVDAEHLGNALAVAEPGSQLILKVGAAWLKADGTVAANEPPRFEVAASMAASTRYPFSILSGYPGSATERQWLRDAPILALLGLLGLTAALGTYWQRQRAGSQRQELERALAAGEFIPFFQPIVASDDGRCTGLEVLMRWQHPEDGLIRPDLFIPYAEGCGLIVPMTRDLLRQTAAILAPQLPCLEAGFHVGVNLTAAHCEAPTLVEDCREFLEQFPKGHVQLVLELTERELIVPTAQTLERLAAVRALGVKIALDDFGTGHSSLAYLQQFQVDYLKIDQRFVAMIDTEALSRHIVDSVIALCAKLGLDVVAEGVETAAQHAYLASHGVAYLQGYLFARPMHADAFIDYISSARPRAEQLASCAALG